MCTRHTFAHIHTQTQTTHVRAPRYGTFHILGLTPTTPSNTQSICIMSVHINAQPNIVYTLLYRTMRTDRCIPSPGTVRFKTMDHWFLLVNSHQFWHRTILKNQYVPESAWPTPAAGTSCALWTLNMQSKRVAYGGYKPCYAYQHTRTIINHTKHILP